MNKLLAGFLLALAISTSAFAQEGMRQRRTPEERAKHQVEMMQDLKLTQEQQQDIYKFNMELSSGDAEDKGDKDARMERGTAMREKRAAAYQKILTKDQYAQYEQMQAQRRGMKMKEKEN